VRLRTECRKSVFERIERGIDWIAAGTQTEAAALDFPSLAKLVEQTIGLKAIAHQSA
jgi:hypothetical protein